MSSDSTREQGIAFGDLPDDLRSMDFPATSEKVHQKYGDYELRLTDGSTTLDEALAELGDQTFESPDGVIQAVKNVIGERAVGREGYTDRGGDVSTDSQSDESF